MVRLIGVFSLISVMFLSGCQSAAPAGLREQAAAEATAIIQNAQATALMMQAQAQATAMVAQAAAILEAAQSAQPELASLHATPVIPVQTMPSASESMAEAEPTAPDPAPVSQSVEIHSVTFAADTGFVMVNYLAPPQISANFYQGTVSVINEASGDRYGEVVVVPVIGPLISRPAEPGQIGYVMLVNGAPGLKPGDLVTVKLGQYTFEHVPVRSQ